MAVELYGIQRLRTGPERRLGLHVTGLGIFEDEDAALAAAIQRGKGHYQVCNVAGNLFGIDVYHDGSYQDTRRTLLN